jgi:hypothetical protein
MRQKYTIVVNTANRKDGQNYLGQTIKNLTDASVFESSLLGGFLVYHTDKPYPHNTQQNALRALEKGYENNTEWVIFLEDDVDFISNFLESVDLWLSEFYQPNILFYPLAACYVEVENKEISCWQYPVGCFYGCQAYAIHRSQLEKLIPFFKETNKTTFFMHDMLLQHWGKCMNSEYLLTPCPSFIQHIGQTSAIHDGRYYQYASFPGKEYEYKRRESETS